MTPAENGFLIYPGTLTKEEIFRIGCIGAIRKAYMQAFLAASNETLRKHVRDFQRMDRCRPCRSQILCAGFYLPRHHDMYDPRRIWRVVPLTSRPARHAQSFMLTVWELLKRSLQRIM